MLLMKRNHVSPMIGRIRERLQRNGNAILLLGILPFMYTVALTGKIMPAINPRLGAPAEVTELVHKGGKEGQIFISIAFDGDMLVAVDSNRRIAHWKSNSRSAEDVKTLTALLKKNIYDSVLTSSLSNKSFPFQTRVVLAIDQHLRFGHVKPILYALADAKITQYSFETKASSDEQEVFGELGFNQSNRKLW